MPVGDDDPTASDPASLPPCLAGYDAHWRDPLEHLQWQSGTYHGLATAVRGLAAELCGGRLLMLLEGGYVSACCL